MASFFIAGKQLHVFDSHTRIFTNIVHAGYNWQCARAIAPCGLMCITLWKVLHVKVIRKSLFNPDIYWLNIL